MLLGNKEHKNFNPRDTFIGGLVILLIAGIFFVPELVKLTKNIGKTKEDKVLVKVEENEKEKSVEQTEEEKAGLKTEQNSLDQVITRFDKNRYSTQQKLFEAEEKVETKKASGSVNSFFDRLFGRTGGSSGNIQSRKSGVGKKKMSSQQQLEKVIAAGEMSWKILMHKDVIAAIKEAQKKAGTIQKQLNTSKAVSTSALDKYINTLNKITGGSFKNFKAQDVIIFLSTMDKNVTKAFAMERVPRSIYVQWLQLGLDPLLKTTDAPVLKRQLLPTFRVDILLVGVKASDQIRKNNYTRKLERVKSNIAVSGIIRGNDASEIEIYRGTELLQRKKVKLNKKKPETPIKFTFRYKSTGDTNGIAGNYLVRVKDDAGNYYQKFYRFDPTLRSFRQNKSGNFQIPKLDRMTAIKTRAYDQYFVVGESGTDLESTLGISSGFTGGYDALNDNIEGLSEF